MTLSAQLLEFFRAECFAQGCVRIARAIERGTAIASQRVCRQTALLQGVFECGEGCAVNRKTWQKQRARAGFARGVLKPSLLLQLHL